MERVKGYNPDKYPRGTSLDIKEDEGDGIHVKSFVSFSVDEGEKEKKERRSEYKFQKRVAKKIKHDKNHIEITLHYNHVHIDIIIQ